MALDLRRQQEICEAALELPHGERAAFVARETAGDDEDQARILALLREYESSDEVLNAALWPDTNLSNQVVGSYRLLEKIGEGGMGEVYLAEQKDRYSAQKVAVKLLTRTRNSQELAARFGREKDILAQLNHPNIPKLMYSGEHRGAPYIVMEYIAGSDLLTYCDDNELSADERLELFLQVLEATKFAHAELIVHRDLKPENILVDAQGRVKVLDFGIAKILADTESSSSDTEHFGRMPLSPGYAPPEQWLGQKANTAVDAYALGVLLNQLLCGCMPFTNADLDRQRTQVGYVPRRRSMVEALEGLDEATVVEIAAKRQTTAASLRRTLVGDLQSIVFKATERDRQNRYASAADLATDIERYRSGEMVAARAVTTLYRLSRWWHRNKVPAFIGSMMILMTAIIAAMGVANAVQSRKQAQETEQARASTETVLNILIDMLQANDPDALQPKETTVREALVEGSNRVISDLTDTPEIQLRVLSIVGSIYKELGLHHEALRYLNAARDAVNRLPADATNGDDVSALKVDIMSNIGDALLGTGEYEKAQITLDEALDLADQTYGRVSAPALNVLNSRKELLHYQNRYPEAMAAAEEALAVSSQLDDDAFRVKAIAKSNYGVAKMRMGEPKAAVAALREASRVQAAALPDDHPEHERVQANLAAALLMDGQSEAASRVYSQIIETSERRGAGHNRTLVQAIYGLGNIELGRGDATAAAAHFEKALTVNKAYKKERDRDVTLTRLFLSIALSVNGDFARADEVLRPALLAQAEHHPNATMTARLYARMGTVAMLRNDPDMANEMLARANEILTANPNPPPHHRAAALMLSGRIDYLAGNRARAHESLIEARDLFAGRYGDRSALGAHARLWLDELDEVIIERALAR